MELTQSFVRDLKVIAAVMPTAYRLVKPKTGADEIPEKVDHLKVMLRLARAGKYEKLNRYIDEVNSIGEGHSNIIKGLESRYQSIL
jgi:hypothetical protein